ncbi:MAG: peptidoglycan DD-metalloendopeptidase family protein [Hyphomonadaceae bacterium]
MSASSHARRRGRVTFPAPPGAAAITVAAFALAGCVGAGFAAQAFATAPEPIKATSYTLPPQAPDLVNPTGHSLRGEDVYGAGAFGASRGGGSRRHRGADYVAEPGEVVRAPITGVVQRIGFAYRGDERYRYVELTSEDQTRDVRVLYVGPLVELGAVVRAGEPIGRAQDLSRRYPRGITNHVHVEMRENGALADPADVLPAASDQHGEIDA